MARPALELAGVVRQHGRLSGLSRQQERVLRAIASCRTAALGGHVEQCGQCSAIRICYNSCRNRHCPKCQSLARAQWLEARQADLLPVAYFHVVFTLPPAVADIALQNQAAVYGLLFQASARTVLTIARDPRHLGAEPGLFSVLHTWGQNLLHHPHVHCVVTGGGLSPDGERWIACRPGFFLPVRVLSRLFRRLFLEGLDALFAAGRLQFHGRLRTLQKEPHWREYLAPLRRSEWVVYAKPPFGSPRQVIQYLGRYTHRVAISNQRLLAIDDQSVTFQWKDYRSRHREKSRTMTLEGGEFLRRFLLHVLPRGLQRIRHYGFLASCHRREKLARIRERLANPTTELLPDTAALAAHTVSAQPSGLRQCPVCGEHAMRVLPGIPRSWWDRPGWNSS
jgi:hypothetical protein